MPAAGGRRRAARGGVSMKARLRVSLPSDRLKLGTVELLKSADPASGFPWQQVIPTIKCYGKADNLAAAGAGNPKRDPLRLYGDFPLGEYSCRLVLVAPPDKLGDTFKREYGPYGFIELTAVSGDALTAAKNGRYGLRVHSGALTTAGTLRPTHGCLRLSDADFLALRQAIEDLGTLEVFELVADVLPEVPLPLAS